MKQLILLLIILSINLVSAIPVPEDNYINDFAKVLTLSDKETLREMYYIVEQNTTAQIVFVSMENIEEEISDYAIKIGEEWGVGQSDKDNGIVILYVKETNKIWVSTGYGVEGILPDSKIGRLLDEYYVPLRNTEEISQAIVQFSFALSEELILNSQELISNNESKPNYFRIIMIIIIILVILVVISNAKRRPNGALPIFIPHKSSGGSSFGGSFGGGSFGGGGAGR